MIYKIQRIFYRNINCIWIVHIISFVQNKLYFVYNHLRTWVIFGNLQKYFTQCYACILYPYSEIAFCFIYFIKLSEMAYANKSTTVAIAFYQIRLFVPWCFLEMCIRILIIIISYNNKYQECKILAIVNTTKIQIEFLEVLWVLFGNWFCKSHAAESVNRCLFEALHIRLYHIIHFLVYLVRFVELQGDTFN